LHSSLRRGFRCCAGAGAADWGVLQTQERVYNRIGKPLLQEFIDGAPNRFAGWHFLSRYRYSDREMLLCCAGFNTCLFAYGQTSSGKSYTMVRLRC
jgi:hypothetical protein